MIKKKKPFYVLAGESWYDTSDYSVTPFDYYISQYKTRKQAERALKKYDDSELNVFIIEVDADDVRGVVERLKYNANIL